MIRRTKFDAHWEALNAARAALGLPPSPAGDAKRDYHATMRAASASGLLDWLARTDQYLQALGQPHSALGDALPLWRAGLDADAAAHHLIRARATQDNGQVRLGAIARSLPKP